MSRRFWREAMRRERRTHSPEFKAKVALAVIQGDLSMAELVKTFDYVDVLEEAVEACGAPVDIQHRPGQPVHQ